MSDKTKWLTLDIETTGLDLQKDEVVELAIELSRGDDVASLTWRFRPHVPIAPNATEVHKITDKDVRDKPRFTRHASEIASHIERSDIVMAYNTRFDLAILRRQFNEEGIYGVFDEATIIDPLTLWRQMEPRNLEGAYARFVGGEVEDSHTALGDVKATRAVMAGMIKAWGLEDKSPNELADLCFPERKNWIGPTHHFLWKGDKAVIGFGKMKEKPLYNLRHDKSYCEFILRKDFPEHVKEIVRILLGETHSVDSEDEFHETLGDLF